MTTPAVPRRILYLVTEGLSPARLEELHKIAQVGGATTEILTLTETNSAEALRKIFAADTVAVWGELLGK